MKKWRTLCGIPQTQLLSNYLMRWKRVPLLLDELEEIHPVPNGDDKYSILVQWIATSPLMKDEIADARWYIANQIC